MKRTAMNIFYLLIGIYASINIHAQDTLSTFIEQNPNAIGYNIIYDGTTVNLSADDDYLLVNLSVAHPALQMRFMMQKVTMYIDPTGKKKKKYKITLPSALDVRQELEETGEMDRDMSGLAQPNQREDTRPDIRPMLRALNNHGAYYNCKGTETHLGYQYFYIEHDRDTEKLNYYVMIPKSDLMSDEKLSDKWMLGIFSINDFASAPPEPQDGDGMMPPPMGADDRMDFQELMQSDIREWVKFSIDEVNNANLR